MMKNPLNMLFLFLAVALVLFPSALFSVGVKEDLSPLVETEWLERNSVKARLRIVEIGRKPEAYDQGHIPGAVFVDRKVVWDKVGGVPGMMPAAESAAKSLEQLGIGSDTTVVIYDGSRGLWAARLYWALEYLGHEKVYVLNGGYAKWTAEGRAIGTDVPSYPRGTLVVTVDPEKKASKKWVLENLNNNDVKIVDTRSGKEYTGEDARADRGGHIPGSVHINWVLNVLEGGTFLPADELAEMYDSKDVSKDKSVVTLCQTGVRGAHTYFVLRLLGYEDVKLYDGSWAEWGNAKDTPVIEGE